ncbi:MAG: amino acid ABC transporter permease [Sporichthyaceae bacterium]
MDIVLDNFALFRSGLVKTLVIAFWAGLGSFLLGTLLASLRVGPVPPLRWFATAYVTLVRNCPLTVVLFFIAFGIPEIGINASYYRFAVGALIIYTAAFMCEAVRSGINAVPLGQAEAARAIGLGFVAGLRHVVLPQALRSVVPPLGSTTIAMIKNSAIVGAFGVGGELFGVINTLTGSQGLDAFPVITGVAVGYLLITIPAGLAFGVLERRVAVAR